MLSGMAQSIRNGLFALYSGESKNLAGMFNRQVRSNVLVLCQVLLYGPNPTPVKDVELYVGTPSCIDQEGELWSPKLRTGTDGTARALLTGTYDAAKPFEIDYELVDRTGRPFLNGYINSPTPPPPGGSNIPGLPWPDGVYLTFIVYPDGIPYDNGSGLFPAASVGSIPAALRNKLNQDPLMRFFLQGGLGGL